MYGEYQKLFDLLGVVLRIRPKVLKEESFIDLLLSFLHFFFPWPGSGKVFCAFA